MALAQEQLLGNYGIHIAHSLAMSACGLVLALVFWQLHRAHRTPHLRLWTFAWIMVAVQHTVGGLLLTQWFLDAPGSAMRIALSIVTQASHYLQAAFMLLGTAALGRSRPLPRHVHTLTIGAILVGVIAVTLATIPADPTLRANVRLAMRYALVGSAFVVGAVATLFVKRPTTQLGRLVVATSFAGMGGVTLFHFVWFGSWSDGSLAPATLEAINLGDVLAQSLVGVGLVVWALEDQRLIATERGRQLHERSLQLLAAQKMEAIGRLAGGVAHDFNNVLTVIHSICDQFELDPTVGGASREALNDLRRIGRQATKMTSQLLSMASSRVGEPRVFDLARVVRDMATTLRRLLGDRLQLTLSVPATPCPVRLQRGQAEQVLLNLVINARDAMLEAGTIDVQLKVHDGPPARVELAVVDRGQGMSHEVRARAMEPFFSTKGDRGTGLGLAVVYGIAKQSGGEVAIDSAVGNGTTFRITWPAAKGVPEESATLPPAPPPRPRAQRRTILIAEDEPNVLHVTSQTLEHAGYDVLAAADAESALQLVQSHPGRIDALLSDVVMPGMNGPDLARAVLGVRPELKVMYVSGYVDAQSSALMDADAPLLNKPFTRRQLLAYLEEHLGHSA